MTQHDTEHLKFQLDITQALLSSVSTADPVEGLVSRLSVICQGAAIIYDVEGSVIASTGAAPTHLIWNEVAATSQRELTCEIGRWRVQTRRVSLRGGMHVIALASHSDVILEKHGETLLDTAELMLGAVHGIRYGAVHRNRRDSEQLLAALHDGIVPSREHRFWSRLAQFEFQAYSPLRVAEIAPFAGGAATEYEVTQLTNSARYAEVPLLLMLRRTEIDSPATIAALISDTPAAERWLTEISAQSIVGVSSSFTALTRVPVEVREATISLSIAQKRESLGIPQPQIGVVWNDRIDLLTWLLSHADSKELNKRIEREVQQFSDPISRDTLIRYFALDQNIARTAEALFVHPNTVRYRLSRIEHDIGQPIASTAVVSNVRLAFNGEVAAARYL